MMEMSANSGAHVNDGFEADVEAGHNKDLHQGHQVSNNELRSAPASSEEFEDLEFSSGPIMRHIDVVHSQLIKLLSTNWKVIKIIILLSIFVGYNVYLGMAIKYQLEAPESQNWQFCDGTGFLLLMTGLVYVLIANDLLLNRTPIGKHFSKRSAFISKKFAQITKKMPWISSIVYLALLIMTLGFLWIDTEDDRRRFVSFGGLLALVLIGFLISKHPGRVVWRHVIWGLALQFFFGIIVLRWSLGQAIFQCLADKVSVFLDFTDNGSIFVFGYLAGGVNQTIMENNENVVLPPVFLFKVLSVIYFFSFIVAMLFHLGLMQWIVVRIGGLLQLTVGTTACESLNAAANIFLGQTEAPLLIKPFLPRMTKSELHAVMTGGFATIAGGVLAAYINFGVDAAHLLSASIMSAPAALACAKLLYPETKVSRTNAKDLEVPRDEDEANLLDAASKGAVSAAFVVASIGAVLVAMLAFVAFLNAVLAWLGHRVGIEDLSFELLLGKMFIPLAFLMGVAPDDLEEVAVLIGLKTFINEFAAYDRLASIEHLLEPRSKVIATYALCGFSNPGSIGIQVAGLGLWAPDRRADLADVAFRAFVAGSLACFLTACVAGTLVKA